MLWDRGGWNAAVLVSTIGSFASNRAGNPLAQEGIAAFTVAHVHAGYTFGRGVWRGWGKGTSVGIGIDDIFDRAPPFADTVFGYNGGLHSPLGRSYEVSVRWRF